MKIIRSFLLITVCICSANFLQAQDIKAGAKKITAIKPTAPPAEINEPSPPSAVKPMNGIEAKSAPVVATQVPSPAAHKQPALKPLTAAPVQDAPQNPNNDIPQPGVLKKHKQ